MIMLALLIIPIVMFHGRSQRRRREKFGMRYEATRNGHGAGVRHTKPGNWTPSERNHFPTATAFSLPLAPCPRALERALRDEWVILHLKWANNHPVGFLLPVRADAPA